MTQLTVIIADWWLILFAALSLVSTAVKIWNIIEVRHYTDIAERQEAVMYELREELARQDAVNHLARQ